MPDEQAIEAGRACFLPPFMKFDVAATFPTLLPRALAWVDVEERRVLAAGSPLTEHGLELARSVGVRHPERIRLYATDELPAPDDPELRKFAFHIDVYGPGLRALTLGYAVSVRRGMETSARVLSHEFRHVYQCEMLGSTREFVRIYLSDVVQYGYSRAPLELDARAHEIGND